MAWRAIFKYQIYNYMNKFTTYIQESIAEMKKVTWPTKKETYNYTLLVIGISLGTAIFLGILDYLFTQGFSFIIK
jgi:preprotein translocase subunit SecE